MNEKKKRKKQQSFEQKLYAIQEVIEKGRHKKDVAVELDIHINTITNWIRNYKVMGADGFCSSASVIDPDIAEELKRLRIIEKKFNEQQVEIEILKKFQAFLKVNEEVNVTKR